jgi:hypothetical protein
MPRLSLYRPNKTRDYEFLDKVVYEQFLVGGTDINIHKYLGPRNPSEAESTAAEPQYDAVKETNIQDMLFLENRDRKYDEDVYTMRGVYNVTDTDFNLSQFGLFLSNDTIFMTIHINSSVKTLGRKIISGYVVEDVTRAAEGFSQTWYPHLYRVKLKQIVDSQEYKEILDLPAEDEDGNNLRDILSTFEREMQVNNAVVAQADEDAPLSGYDVSHFYTLQVDDNGDVEIVTADVNDIDASAGGSMLADRVYQTPERQGYKGYLLGVGSVNGEVFGSGISFPVDNAPGDYFLRTDFLPNRLFRYDGTKWAKVQDGVRTEMSNTDTKRTQVATFINNTNTNTIGGESISERQSLSKALKPKVDD